MFLKYLFYERLSPLRKILLNVHWLCDRCRAPRASAASGDTEAVHLSLTPFLVQPGALGFSFRPYVRELSGYCICAANSAGLRSPSAEGGLSVLYSCCQSLIERRASSKLENDSVFKHSSRNRPLNDSI